MLPLTRPEATGDRETSRHADVMAFLAALDAWEDPRFVLSSFGTSPEGRDLPLVVMSATGVRTPEQAHMRGLPVVLIINGIHAGEVEGKESSLKWMRSLLTSGEGELLEHVTLVVVPLFNPDGNDRIDPRNRALDIAHLEGQIGPVGGVGTRVNAAGINLNRDYLRQDAPEMVALSRNVVQRWLPHLTIDCHATNGSIHRFALTYDTPHTVESGAREPIAWVREQLLPEVSRRLRASAGLDTFFYGNFVRDEGGEGPGWMTYTHHPRFGSNYRGLTNRMDILSEVYSYLPFPERVHATYEFVRAVVRLAAERGSEILGVVGAARTPSRVAVRYRLEAEAEPVEILSRDPYALDGAPVSWTVPHLARFVGAELVERPWAYAVPDALAQRLAGHGLRVTRAARALWGQGARVTGWEPEASRRILESSLGERQLQVEPLSEPRRVPTGTALVETGQQNGAVAVYLCEPLSDDGIVACGWAPELAPGQDFPALRLIEV